MTDLLKISHHQTLTKCTQLYNSGPQLVRRDAEALTEGLGTGVFSAVRQQRYSKKLLRRPQTIWDVATRPPTLAQSLTRNWNKPNLEIKEIFSVQFITKTIRVKPVFCDFHFEGGEIIFKIYSRRPMRSFVVVYGSHVLLHTVLICCLQAGETHNFCRNDLDEILDIDEI